MAKYNARFIILVGNLDYGHKLFDGASKFVPCHREFFMGARGFMADGGG